LDTAYRVIDPRHTFVQYRHPDWTAFYIKNQYPLSLIVIQLKVNIDFQLVDQPHTSAFRLFKSTTAYYLTRPFVCDAKHQLATAIVCQGAATPCGFSKVKPIFRLFELDVFAFLCFQKFWNGL